MGTKLEVCHLFIVARDINEVVRNLSANNVGCEPPQPIISKA